MKLNTILGSETVEESVAGKEVVPSPPSGYNPYRLVEFSLQVEADCTVSINNASPIFVRAGTLNISENQPDIVSFRIMKDGVKFNWMAAL